MRPMRGRDLEEELENLQSPCIWLGGCPKDVTEREIERVCARYGEVQNVTIKHSVRDTFVFVEYTRLRDAKDAIRGMDQTRLFGTGVVKVAPASRKNSQALSKDREQRGGSTHEHDRDRDHGDRDRNGAERERTRDDRDRDRDRADRGERGRESERDDRDRVERERADRDRADRDRADRDRGDRDRLDRDRADRDRGDRDRVDRDRPDRDRADRDRVDRDRDRVDRDRTDRERSDRDRDRDRDRREDPRSGGRYDYSHDGRDARDGRGPREDRDYREGRDYHDGRDGRDYRGRNGYGDADGRPRGGDRAREQPRSPSVGRSRSPLPKPSTRPVRVYLSQLPRDMEEPELREFGQEYGNVLACELHREGAYKCGWMEYATKREGEAAVRELDDRRLIGWTMRIQAYLYPGGA